MFEKLEEKRYLLNMRGYHAFCKDFKLPVSSAKVTELWKKASVNHQPHTFDQFFESMRQLGKSLQTAQITALRKRSGDIKQLV